MILSEMWGKRDIIDEVATANPGCRAGCTPPARPRCPTGGTAASAASARWTARTGRSGPADPAVGAQQWTEYLLAAVVETVLLEGRAGAAATRAQRQHRPGRRGGAQQVQAGQGGVRPGAVPPGYLTRLMRRIQQGWASRHSARPPRLTAVRHCSSSSRYPALPPGPAASRPAICRRNRLISCKPPSTGQSRIADITWTTTVLSGSRAAPARARSAARLSPACTALSTHTSVLLVLFISTLPCRSESLQNRTQDRMIHLDRTPRATAPS